MGYTNSSLATYKKLAAHHYGQRTHVIDTISIHVIVGQWTAKQGCDYFATTDRYASCNYVVGKDGSIGLCVEEKNASMCSSNKANDNRAITIEVASDTTHPYAVTDKALNALIELLADICKRNGIKELKWKGDKSLIGQVDKQNMTVHRWFANKACCGDYLYNKHGWIAEQVNKKLGTISSASPSTNTTKVSYTVKVDKVQKNDVLNIRKEPNANSAKTGNLKWNDPNVYTIVEEKNGWGKLKSGVGWINLYYTKKVTAKTATVTKSQYYGKYTGTSYGIDTVLRAIGVEEKFIGSWAKRKPVATANAIKNYTGTQGQNNTLIALAKQGKLKRV